MKNNSFLYVLLVFLIIVNGFFIYNFLNADKLPEFAEPKNVKQFIAETLEFNESQKAQFYKLEKAHHKELRKLGDDTKFLKDRLFNKLSDTSVSKEEIDSITRLIGDKEVISNKKIFNYFKEIEAICNSDAQRKAFKTIIQDAIGKPEHGRAAPPSAHHPPPPNGRGLQAPPPERK